MLELVRRLNADDEVDAILVQLPLPGEHRRGPGDRGRRSRQGRRRLPSGQRGPALPRAADARAGDAARHHGAARATTACGSTGRGRSSSAGARSSASPSRSCCSRRTRRSRSATRARDDLARYTSDADVLVVAAGTAGLVSADMVKPGAAVVDVGQNRTDAGLVGDVDAGAAEVAALLTPVPGRRRADDGRNAASEHASDGRVPPRHPCVPRGVTLSFGRFTVGATARCPGRRFLL